MAKLAPNLNAEMNIRCAVRLMDQLGLTHAVVLDDRHLVGIVMLRDPVGRYIGAIERPASGL